MEDVPPFQQTGIELILDTLRASDEPVDILSFGSARTLARRVKSRTGAAAREGARLVHLSAGAAAPPYQEWNVLLDPCAIVRSLRSDLPIALYRCATAETPFGYDRHNSFWLLPDLRFIGKMGCPPPAVSWLRL